MKIYFSMVAGVFVVIEFRRDRCLIFLLKHLFPVDFLEESVSFDLRDLKPLLRLQEISKIKQNS